MAADPVHVDLRGFQDLRHKEPVTHGHDDIPGLYHNAVPEGVLLVQQFNHNGLQGFDGRGRAGGDQVVVGGIEQGHAVKDRGVVEQDGIHLLVDRPLGGGRVHTGHLGDKAHVVVDKRLPGHGELAAVGCHLALGEKFGLRGVVFQFSVFAHAQELTGAAGQILVVLGGLKVGHAALGGPHLEGGGHGLVSLHNGLADRVVQDRREGRRGVEELAAGHAPQVVLGHTEEGGGGAQALPGHTLDCQIPQGQAAHLLRALGGTLHVNAATHQQGVRGRLPEVVLLSAIVGHSGAHGAVVLDQKIHGRRPHVVHAGAAADVLRRIHAGLAAKGHNVGGSLALLRHGPLAVAHTALDGSGRGALAAVLRAALTAGGLADGLAALVACGVDHGLAAVKLRLLLGGQVPALVSRQGHKFLLAGKGFLQFIHGFLTSCWKSDFCLLGSVAHTRRGGRTSGLRRPGPRPRWDLPARIQRTPPAASTFWRSGKGL